MGKSLSQKIEAAISVLKEFEPPEGYFVAFSGGKDSIVILDLVRKSGVKHDANFNRTSVDPPELIAFIKEHYPDVNMLRPEKTMFQLIDQWDGFLPTKRHRYCCAYLKEYSGSGRIVITGVRRQESRSRAKRKQFETSYTDKTKRFIHIIIDWSEDDVWEYIRRNKLAYPSLYDEGFKRIGCIGCPMVSAKEIRRQFKLYPNYRKAYINTIQKCLDRQPDKNFKDAEEKLAYWISRTSVRKFKERQKQMSVFGEGGAQ